MNKDEYIRGILDRHMHWLKQDCPGWENMRADLRDWVLSGADLRTRY